MKCPFCTKVEKKDVMIPEIIVSEVNEHLIVTKSGEHFHVHGPKSKKDLIVEFLEAIAKEAGLEIENS